MPADLPSFSAGDIVLADWRGDALPGEPNKQRPAVVVKDSGLFAAGYPNVILVPLTNDETQVIEELSVSISPTAENGCTKPCWAAGHLVTTTSKRRLTSTRSNITAGQVEAIRRSIAELTGAVPSPFKPV